MQRCANTQKLHDYLGAGEKAERNPSLQRAQLNKTIIHMQYEGPIHSMNNNNHNNNNNNS